MGMQKGPPPKAEKDRSERWLLTYADLITLLLIFFIVLYSMSKIDAKRFEEMSKSLAIAFGSAGRSGMLDAGRSVIPGDRVYKEQLEMQNTEERIRRMIAQQGLEGKISTDLGARGLVVSVKDTVLFSVGSADLTPAARGIMKNVTTILRGMPNAIRIEGHSDTVPIHTERYYSNWELSTARATNVLQFFIQEGGIAPDRLSAAGYGEYKPIVPNSNDRNRALNRRVDIVLLSSAYSKFEPGGVLGEGMKKALPPALLTPAVKDTGMKVDITGKEQ
jgi:chemotaxis protein MotB